MYIYKSFSYKIFLSEKRQVEEKNKRNNYQEKYQKWWINKLESILIKKRKEEKEAANTQFTAESEISIIKV